MVQHNIGSDTLNISIGGSNGYTWSGTSTKGGCDPFQSNWCEGLVDLNSQLFAGTYTVTIDSVSMCSNPSGLTTLVVYGCPVEGISDLKSCAAVYTNDGKLHIPYVSVPDVLGGKFCMKQTCNSYQHLIRCSLN